ncbi:uncharacterized protein LOC110245182 [Exaiptasia diaphana]|uniref:Uncharacterized protein n=1 Tax=Exaiptasia diaphana TaxID=2652724 RepID=A0A913XND3_EXADI|nr:uncharacterized protein LOC110245182 [Exaiptasia diaphana]
MKNESFLMMIVLLGQLLTLRVVLGYPVNWWNPMFYNQQYNTGFPRPFPALDESQPKDKVGRKPDGFRPPVFPNFYAPNMQFNPFPNYYPGMLPPYPAYPNPQFNFNNRIDDDRNGKKKDEEESKENDDSKSVTIPPYSNFMPGYYAPGYAYPNYYPGKTVSLTKRYRYFE